MLRLGADSKQQELSAAVWALFWPDRTDDPFLARRESQATPSLKHGHTFSNQGRSLPGQIKETPLALGGCIDFVTVRWPVGYNWVDCQTV